MVRHCTVPGSLSTVKLAVAQHRYSARNVVRVDTVCIVIPVKRWYSEVTLRNGLVKHCAASGGFGIAKLSNVKNSKGDVMCRDMWQRYSWATLCDA